MREDQTFKPLKPGTIHDLPQCELNYVYVTQQILPRLKKGNEDPPEDIFDVIERGPFVITGFIHMNEETQIRFAHTSRKTVFIKLRNVYLYKIEQLPSNSLLIWVVGQRALYAIRNVSDEYKETFDIVIEKANLYLYLRSIRKSETEDCIFTFPEYLEQISHVLGEKELVVKNKMIKYSKFLFFMMLDDVLLNWQTSLFFKDLKQLCNDSFKIAELNKKKVEILRNEAVNTLKLTNSFTDESIINNKQKLDDSFQLQHDFFNVEFLFKKSQNRILTYPFPRANAEGRKLYNDLKKALMYIPFKPEDLDIETAAIFLGNDLNSVNDMREKIKDHAEGLIDFIKISKKWEKSILFKQLIDISKGIDICLKETDSMFFKNEDSQKLYEKKNKIYHNTESIKNIPNKRTILDLNNSSAELSINNNVTYKTDLTSKKEFLYKITDQLISELIDSQKYAKKYNLKIFIDNITKNFKISYRATLKFILQNIEYFANLAIQKHTEIYKDLENMLIFKLNFLKNPKLKLSMNKQLKTSKYNILKSNASNFLEDSCFKNKKKLNKKKYIENEIHKSKNYNTPSDFETIIKDEILDPLDIIYKSSDTKLDLQKLNNISTNFKKNTECLKETISHDSYKSPFNINTTFNNKRNKLNLNLLKKHADFPKNEKEAYNNNPKQNTMNEFLSNTNLKHELLCEDTINKPNHKIISENLSVLIDKSPVSEKKNIITYSDFNKSNQEKNYLNTEVEADLQPFKFDNSATSNDSSFNKFTKILLESSLIRPGRGKPMLQIIPLPPTQPSQNSKLWFCPVKDCNYFSETFISNRIFKTIIKHLKYHRSILSSKDKYENSEHQLKNKLVRDFVDKIETITTVWNLQLNES
ncbi:uncharacterized protein T551_00062 [Pneumocystis jirovecii RU7]|uniref:Uncharacterized protein n=1 Tax=Pneumocystis jirovecii (strain RU7) TaxID=1408657 RepID=A0A0W4ZW28_PNEJ7|nr:uncharacterized protein T551_00062 [Pneumocystis jirovecii RU7]KTW32577.1 hypothetical protein T551_00062 [Pneumocystis jirovecii RU7]